jgi:hypothetical protein
MSLRATQLMRNLRDRQDTLPLHCWHGWRRANKPSESHECNPRRAVRLFRDLAPVNSSPGKVHRVEQERFRAFRTRLRAVSGAFQIRILISFG